MDKKIALVTGGNRGIGQAIVHGLVKNDFYVLMGCRDITAAKKELGGISENIEPISLDVSDEHSIVKAKAFIEKKHGVVDVLVNNAGIVGQNKKSIKEGDIHDIRIVMEVNYFGPMRMNSVFLDLLRKSEDARIINISSSMGALNDLKGPYPGYRLSKAGLNTQTILLANDLEAEGIKVFAMNPGWTQTAMGGPNAAKTPDEGADTALWLASDKNASSGKFYDNRQEIPW